MGSYCCDMMRTQILGWQCPTHTDRYECPDALIDYAPQFDEYGIIVHDGGTSTVLIQFCPWCGTKLPMSQRTQWFEELEALGFSDPEQDRIPDKYRTDEWRRNK